MWLGFLVLVALLIAFDLGVHTILAVDDEALILMNTVWMLEELGDRVLEASSGAAALSLLTDADTGVDLVERHRQSTVRGIASGTAHGRQRASSRHGA